MSTINRKYVQAQDFTLAGSGVSVGDTIMVLSSFTININGVFVPLTMAHFGTKGYMTNEPNNSSDEEGISFSGVTQNTNGTATITGINSVLLTYPYTETTGFSKSHAGGTHAIITNTDGFYNDFTNKQNDETILGQWAVPDPIGMTNIANKEYVLSVVNGGTVSVNQVIVSGSAGENLTAGNFVYLKVSDGLWHKTSASVSSTSQNVMIGIAQGTTTSGNPITGGVLVKGVDTNQSGLTQGVVYYLANTAGTIASTAGTNTQVIGQASSATTIYFDPYFIFSSLGISALNFQNNTQVYFADSGTANTYAITASPTATSYVAGQRWYFKSGNANTGASTFNVNALGAKTIVKNQGATLLANDIKAGQIVEVVYDGTNFQMVSPVANIPTFSNGIANKNLTDASTSQTIAHGLGLVPTRVTFQAVVTSATTTPITAFGIYDGSGQNTVGTIPNTSTAVAGATANKGLVITTDNSDGRGQSGVVTVDATNITITWTKSSTPTGTASILWSAQA